MKEKLYILMTFETFFRKQQIKTVNVKQFNIEIF